MYAVALRLFDGICVRFSASARRRSRSSPASGPGPAAGGGPGAGASLRSTPAPSTPPRARRSTTASRAFGRPAGRSSPAPARCRCRPARPRRHRTTHAVQPLPERVRLVAAPGELRGLELEVRGWTTDEQSGDIALSCRLVDGSVGEIPARWTDLPVVVEPHLAVGGFGSPVAWRLLVARGERLAERRADRSRRRDAGRWSLTGTTVRGTSTTASCWG